MIRDKGCKEAKLATISAVEVRPAVERPAKEEGASRRDEDPLVRLKGHSCEARLWDADTMALHQNAEGLRRGIDHCQRLSSVNDGAPWIERITDLSFPEAVQLVDWHYAEGKLWKGSEAVFGEQSPEGRGWVEERLAHLWSGKVKKVETALEELDLDRECWRDAPRQAPGYFESNLAHMRYGQFRAEGYPIGSGTVESGCNNVVQHRMRRPGRGWRQDSADYMLAGLCELNSGRFTHTWQRIHHPLHQTYARF